MNIIDFVLPWVDNNDPKWQNDLNKYNDKYGDKDISRFRDWDNLQYLFRAFEEFTPWVNKIYFITYGHIPEWLNIKHPKLVIVKHEDFIPKENLPIFNSHAIEVNLHNIKGLSENFVYFNDDTFILKKIPSTVFFRENLPVNVAISNVMHKGKIAHVIVNNIAVINRNFNRTIKRRYQKRRILEKYFSKWFYYGYGFKMINNLLLLNWISFTGFYSYHHPQPFLKQTFLDVWEKEYELLSKVSKSKFRNSNDVNQYLFKYWQFVTGKFMPDSYKNAYVNRKYINLKNNKQADEVKIDLESNKYEMYCINDDIVLDRYKDKSRVSFEYCKNTIKEALDNILPNKSKFEL